MTRAIDEIAAERLRQIEKEGWSLEHDDSHSGGEMALAAGCYALFAGGFTDMGRDDDGSAWSKPQQFPWDAEWWKPKDRRRNLIVAAALLVAEIERLDRAEEKTRWIVDTLRRARSLSNEQKPQLPPIDKALLPYGFTLDSAYVPSGADCHPESPHCSKLVFVARSLSNGEK